MTIFDLQADTVFSGECQHCRAAGNRRRQFYHPLAPRGGSRAYAPSSAQMGVTCTRCGGPMVLFAHLGQTYEQALIVGSREELDLSGLRRHLNEMHRQARIRGVPRRNIDAAGWHLTQHHRYHLDHIHMGPYVLVRNARGSVTGQIARPLGWWTGAEAKTRAQLQLEWAEAHGAVSTDR